MTPAIIGFLLYAAGVALPAQTPPADLHLVVESQFNYLAATRTTTTDVWMSAGRRATKVGDILTIRRDDLGVRWRIDLKAGSYSETKIEQPAPAPPPSKVDVHTVGYAYLEPEFDWTPVASDQTTAILGRPCRRFQATGDADYAEGALKFWVCDPIAGVTLPVTDVVLGSMRSPSARKFVEQTAAREGNRWVLGVEETQEPPIAPTITITVTVKTLDAAVPAPAGTFDLPANVKKAGR